jgi:hypothetical protein
MCVFFWGFASVWQSLTDRTLLKLFSFLSISFITHPKHNKLVQIVMVVTIVTIEFLGHFSFKKSLRVVIQINCTKMMRVLYQCTPLMIRNQKIYTFPHVWQVILSNIAKVWSNSSQIGNDLTVFAQSPALASCKWHVLHTTVIPSTQGTRGYTLSWVSDSLEPRKPTRKRFSEKFGPNINQIGQIVTIVTIVTIVMTSFVIHNLGQTTRYDRYDFSFKIAFFVTTITTRNDRYELTPLV